MQVVGCGWFGVWPTGRTRNNRLAGDGFVSVAKQDSLYTTFGRSHAYSRPSVVGFPVNLKAESEISCEVTPMAAGWVAAAAYSELQMTGRKWALWANDRSRRESISPGSMAPRGKRTFDPMSPVRRFRYNNRDTRVGALITIRDGEVGYSIMVEVEQVPAIWSDDTVGWRVNNLRLDRLSQGQHTYCGCSCRERIHVELVMSWLGKVSCLAGLGGSLHKAPFIGGRNYTLAPVDCHENSTCADFAGLRTKISSTG